MNRTSRVLLWIVLLVGVLFAGYYWWWQQRPQAVSAPPPPVAQPAPEPAVPALPAPAAAPAIQHPLAQAPAEEPLPALEASDARVARALAGLMGNSLWGSVFHPDQVVRRIVATVDNLPRRDAPVKIWPVRPAGSWLQTKTAGGATIIAPENSQRYASYMKVVQVVNAQQLAEVYRHFYPLFQKAYVELGYPQGYFNDRLVAAVDDLLATPELAEPPRLVQPKVLYQFADPELEARSAGQKILLRVGPENARAVKAKLREFRRAIASVEPTAQE